MDERLKLIDELGGSIRISFTDGQTIDFVIDEVHGCENPDGMTLSFRSNDDAGIRVDVDVKKTVRR